MAEKPTARNDEENEVSRALARAAEDAAARRLDEMPDGPRYEVAGQIVDANGVPVKGK